MQITVKILRKKKFSKINAPRLNSKRRKTLKYNNETHYRITRIKVYNSDNSNVKPSTVRFGRINIVI